MTKDDPLHPLSRFLTGIAKDATNVSADFLRLFQGIRAAKRPRSNVKLQIHKLKQEMARTEAVFDVLDEILEVLEANAGETSEHELIGLALKMADSVDMSEKMSGVLALDHIAVAHRILKIPPERFPEVVRELDSYEGGKEQLTEFFAAVWRYYGDEWKKGQVKDE
jgi:hypothetical protein